MQSARLLMVVALLSLQEHTIGSVDACAAAVDGVILASAGNVCPACYAKVSSKSDCKTVGQNNADSIGWEGTETDDAWPAGCYHCTDVDGCSDGTWWNNHGSGAANAGARPWCVKAGGSGVGDGTSIGDNSNPSPPSPPSPSPAASIQGTVMFTGDSDIEGWSTNSKFPGSTNVGVGGWTCKNVLNNIDGQLSTHNPDWVVLVCGENDLAYGANVATTFSRFSSVVAKIRAAGARVLYMGTKPEPDTASLHNKYQAYDAEIRALASSIATADAIAAAGVGAYPTLIMVDVYEGFEAVGNGGNLYQNDGLHLSTQGYTLWTAWSIQAMSTQPTSEMQVVLDCYQWRSGTCLAKNNVGGAGTECVTCIEMRGRRFLAGGPN